MTYKEAFCIVRVWTLRQTKAEIPQLRPSFLRDIAFMRVHQPAIWKEILCSITGAQPEPASHGNKGNAARRAISEGRVTTHAALQERIKRENEAA